MAKSKILNNFYASKPWRDLRNLVILERGNRCEKCGKVFSSDKLHVHHRIELTEENVNDVSISLNKDNLEVKCIDCHNAEHNRFNQGEQHVYIVYGSPCSGKSTYVSQVYNYGDVIIDIDRLYQAITLEDKYIKPNEAKNLVLSTYNYLIELIINRKGNWKNCFIIGSFANKIKRERLKDKLKAELIFINETKENCKNNLYKDKERLKIVNLWEEYINNWFDEYVE